MSWFNFQPQNDIERGREAMIEFHNSMVSFSNYRLTANQLIDQVSKNRPEIFLDSFGFAINSIEMRDAQVKDAMGNLARRSAGIVPDQTRFFSALSERVSNVTTSDYLAGSGEIAAGIAADTVKGAQAVGEAVIDTGKSLLTVGPILIVAAIIFIGYARTRQIAGR